MKWIRFRRRPDGESVAFGIVEGDRVRMVSGHPLDSCAVGRESIALSDVQPLAPFDSSKIVAVGLNYTDHIRELPRKGIDAETPKEPVIFFKAPTALLASGDPILLPPESSRVEYESEIGFYVKRRARRVPLRDAADYIFGYTCVNDVTARDIQRSDVQWTRGKSFDTFCPAGPVVETALDWRSAELQGILNGRVVQSAKGGDMIFDPPTVLSYISQCFTLLPGDLVATGTCKGVGPLQSGDRIVVRVTGIGELENPVRLEKESAVPAAALR